MPKSDLPPRKTPVLIKEIDGRILAGEITSIFDERKKIKLERVIVLEVVGLRAGLEPIYAEVKSTRIINYAFIEVEDIVHWEPLPGYLRLREKKGK